MIEMGNMKIDKEVKNNTRKYSSHKEYLYSKENLNKIIKLGLRSKKNEKNPMYGKKHDKLSRMKMSVQKIGVFNGENNPNWKGGISFEPYGSEFNKKLKEKIRQRDNCVCQECFKSQNTLINQNNRKYKLLVHHIDFNKNNNAENNLISLCRDCHLKTNYNREFWYSHFQKRKGGGFIRSNLKR